MLLRSLLAAAAFVAVTNAATVTFTNTRRFLFDVDGDQIDAYGSKINYFNGTYYLYGNSFEVTGSAFGIKSYSSTDLQNWAYEGFLYNPYATNPCVADGGCGRPHIVYNAASKKYILWANAGTTGYIIATSSSPSSGFVFSSSTAMIDPALAALQPADFAVETFGDQGYLVFSALNFRSPDAGSLWPPIFQSIHISPLTSDFMNTTGVSYAVTSAAYDLVDQETESPDIFMVNGTFYVAASNTCGYCNGTLGLIYRASSIQGPWIRQIISGDSCQGQVEGVLPLTDPKTGLISYVWHSTSVPGGPRTGFSGHIFQPLQLASDGSVGSLNCSTAATFPVAYTPGTTSPSTGLATLAADKSPLVAAYAPVCDSDTFMLHQTWVASKTGTLTSVAVNIAKSSQTVPLTINVFKFSNLSALVAPEYKYTLLATASFTAAQLSYVFNATSVSVNASVAKGDNLGLSIVGADFAPYCHLEYDFGSAEVATSLGPIVYPAATGYEGQVLLQQGSGQYSLRGATGKGSPVYVRNGKGLKFFATVV